MATWTNSNSAAVGGTGEVFTASAGATLPTGVAEPTLTGTGGFVGHGLLSEDGVTNNISSTIQELNVWQQLDPVRRTVTAREILISFAMAQFDEHSIPFAFGGGTITGSNPYTYAFPAADQNLEERAIVVDARDGTELHRFCFSRINVTEPVETKWARDSLALLPVGAKVLAPAAGGSPGSYISSATSFAAGS